MDKQMSKEEEEAANEALIKQLLAEEGQEEYDYYDRTATAGPSKAASSSSKRGRKKKGSDDEDDDDWSSSKTVPKKASKPSRGAQETESEDDLDTRPKKQRKPPKAWTQDEERLFSEGLELYGRDWRKIATHMGGTRDWDNVRSHAQNHFIKLAKAGKPLPAKVRESGEGYTLSGKPLDTSSAAAKKFGDIGQGDQAAPKENTTISAGEVIALDSDEEKTAKPSKKRTPAKKSQPKEPVPEFTDAYDDEGRTSYSSTRLRRKDPKKMQAINYAEMLDDTDPYQMVKCEHFTGGPPGSGQPDAQPFTISMLPHVLAAMDLHAHLAHTEVIGFLAGTWDADKKHMEVLSAYPCRSIENEPQATGKGKAKEKVAFEDDRHVNVEMDPISEFEPDPSVVDLENQTNYQRLFGRGHDSRYISGQQPEPFIGVIVGPYDKKLPTSISAINCFFVSNEKEDRGTPKHLTYDVLRPEGEEGDPNSTLVDEDEVNRMLETIGSYAEREDRVDFKTPWKSADPASESCLQKVIKSLMYRLLPPKGSAKEAESASTDQGKTMTAVKALELVEAEIKKWSPVVDSDA